MFRVAPALADEADALTALVRGSAAYPGEYRVMVAGQRLDAAYLHANVVRVVRGADGRVWGFYSLLFPGHGGPGEAELDFMFVANDRQGQGIGTVLFADMRAVAEERGASRVHIVSHPPAEPFYLANGAQRIGMLAPSGRATWHRPHLVLELSGTPALAGVGAR
ncbi:GNAT family N-acetyltransferase [Phytohabitans houttuyneae]|uniref:N-acetyltransferase n=1 Tax=Phytohabitans houttuyneae TaxID=1076126 RepID=A0A6V8KK94_9ACTN|nr:GNAT family N-acetyltransferase [Phytohabitans houttuyneae]GFJ82898.1 N-acetyltransferase [Phytohabitans houttuyneae]